MAKVVWIFALVIGGVSAVNLGCNSIKSALKQKGLNLKDIPSNPMTDASLSICPVSKDSGTCCTKDIENSLMSWSSQQFKLAIDSKVHQVFNVLRSRTNRIEDLVDTLLSDAQSQFDESFRRTYGVLYERNAQVFSDYFKDLKNFHNNGRGNLVHETEVFFGNLYQKMFQVMNSQFHFGTSYLSCLSKHMNEVNPFGDVPAKVASSVKKSLVAIRTLTMALKSGYSIADSMKKMSVTPGCLAAIQRMNSCPICDGLSESKPCSNFCLNVMNGCLAHRIELQKDWDKFAESILSLTDRLTGPFNVEAIIPQLDITISNGIMNFQEAGARVTEAVFKLCGSPKQQSKREAWNRHNRELNETKPSRDFPHQGGMLKKQKSDLEKILADLRKSVKQTQGFWSRLSFAMCSNSANSNSDEFVFFDSATSEDNSHDFSTLNQKSSSSGINKGCWTGSRNGDYDKRVLENGYESQANNPEVRVKQHEEPQAGLTKEQIFKLKKITNQLKLAYSGEDVEWWNRDLNRREKNKSDYREGSGMDQGEDGLEDDEDFNQSYEGSGAGAHYDDQDEGSGHVGNEHSDDLDEDEGGDEENDDEDGTSQKGIDKEDYWMPFTKEEIEAIGSSSHPPPPPPTTTLKPTTVTPKKSSSSILTASIITIFATTLAISISV